MFRRSLLALVSLPLLAPGTHAQDPTQSTVPFFISLVGQSGDTTPVADPSGEFVVVVRNASGDPMPGVAVLIDFGGCPDLAPAAEQPFPGMVTSYGPPPFVAALTNGGGEAAFNIVGSVVDRTVAPYGHDCATVYANGIPIGSATVVGRDQDGIGGLDAHDVYLAQCDIWDPYHLGQTYWGRSDVSHPDMPVYVFDALDVSELWRQRLEGGSAKTGVRCDGSPTSWPCSRILTATSSGAIASDCTRQRCDDRTPMETFPEGMSWRRSASRSAI